jgi:hypothetical protein
MPRQAYFSGAFFMSDSIRREDLRVLPPWREALQRFLDEPFKPGDLVSHEWLADALGITLPEKDTPYGQAQKMELQYLTLREPLFEALLAQHNVLLKSKPGYGFVYVRPQEQADVTEEDMNKSVNKEMRRAAKRAACVDVLALNDEERKRLANLQMKIAARRSMLRKKDLGLIEDKNEKE